MTTSSYVNDGTLGVDTSAAGVTTPAWTVGKRVSKSDGSQWMYVKASGTIPQYAAAGIDSATTATALTTTTASTGVAVGIAQQAMVSGSYYWILTANPTPPAVAAGVPDSTDNYKLRVASQCANLAKLATTAYGGTLDDTTAGSVLRIDGIWITDTNTASASSSRTFRTAHYGMGIGGTLAV